MIIKCIKHIYKSMWCESVGIIKSRFFESRFFEVPFSSSRCAVIKAVSMSGTEFSGSVYLCVPTCLSSIAVVLHVLLCILCDLSIYFNIS
jgi:hypothetical protein